MPPAPSLLGSAASTMAASLGSRPALLDAASGGMLLHYGSGGMLGSVDYFLNRPRSFTVCAEEDTEAWVFDRLALARLAADAPEALLVFQTALLNAASLSAAHTLEMLQNVHH
ncbi:hypothetical protein H632_c1131p1 [Helicosporidium sp. ATCC 50920]|nr:hypothetical protein H632_c1131p1 [Helicosporidium sp. ATCC 50920]|eukprot:KDD74691.1 hypothetical protein H632_c1131p1 [Helicosporidium sp. ATCC 50920]